MAAPQLSNQLGLGHELLLGALCCRAWLSAARRGVEPLADAADSAVNFFIAESCSVMSLALIGQVDHAVLAIDVDDHARFRPPSL